MPNTKTVSVENDFSTAKTTLSDKMPVEPLAGPQGMKAIGPRVTFNFISDPWSSAKSYDGYDVVQDDGVSYVAIRPVPTGIQLDNTKYWFKWSEPNAQFEQLIGTVMTFDNRIASLENDNTLIYTLAQFNGTTPEERLITALNSIERGVLLCGNITLSKEYIPSNSSTDYRKITIMGATIDLNVDGWFNSAATYVHSVPRFTNCHFIGNGNSIFNAGTLVGCTFDSCYFENTTLVNSSSQSTYVQSAYFVNTVFQKVENLITTGALYDFKMIGCQIESGTSKFIICTNTSLTSPVSINQASFVECLFENRILALITAPSINDLVISSCYFEDMRGGIVNQTANNGYANITFANNLVYRGIETPSTDAMLNISSSAFQNTVIYDNVSNLNDGTKIVNHAMNSLHLANRLKGYNPNASLGDSEWTNGYTASRNGTYTDAQVQSSKAVWNDKDDTWEITWQMAFKEAYKYLHPLILVVSGSIGNVNNLFGAMVSLIPYQATSNSAPIIKVFNEVLSQYGPGGSSTGVTFSTEVENNGITATNTVIKIKVRGATNAVDLNYRIIDPYTIFQSVSKKVSNA